MNPVDSNINIRQTRNDTEQVSRSGASVDRNVATESSSVSSESVSITNTATDLLSLENQLRELPGVDQARVESIRQAISDGNYEVDATRIVDSLLQSEVELG